MVWHLFANLDLLLSAGLHGMVAGHPAHAGANPDQDRDAGAGGGGAPENGHRYGGTNGHLHADGNIEEDDAPAPGNN